MKRISFLEHVHPVLWVIHFLYLIYNSRQHYGTLQKLKLTDIVFITFSLRSNVGKSTLLNSLLSLEESPLIKALVSDKPGETKHLQFYCVGRNEDPKSTVQGAHGLYCVLLAHTEIKCTARISTD
jgi:hypothetical protein